VPNQVRALALRYKQ